VPPYPTNLTVKEIMSTWTIAALGEPTKRPSLKGKFRNHEEIMLYDTGSAITCMGDAAYRRMIPEDVLKEEKIVGARFASASGNEITAAKRVKLRFELLEKPTTYEVFVISTSGSPVSEQM